MMSVDTFTRGVHHIGLTVANLEASASFFTRILAWKEVKRVSDYPAIFVSDGQIMLTLWQAKVEQPMSFDKNANIGLHHLALRVDDLATLQRVYHKLLEHQVPIEFAPELLGDGPNQHMICYEPSGIRIEFIWVSN